MGQEGWVEEAGARGGLAEEGGPARSSWQCHPGPAAAAVQWKALRGIKQLVRLTALPLLP